MSKAAIKRKLDLIAKHINELAETLTKEYGKDAYIYFEAEGDIHAMERDAGPHAGGNERQEFIIETSSYCRFDCGAW